MIGRQRKTACGTCHCGPVWGSGQPTTDTDLYWVVLECVRIANGPISRFDLNDKLENYGVYADEDQRDKQAVDSALLLLLSRHRIEGGDLIAKDGSKETAFTFVHEKPKRRTRRRERRRVA